MSLQDIWEKIKPQSQVEVVALNENGEIESFPLFRKLFLSITIILVVSLSFGIGRLSVVGKREPIKIEYDQQLTTKTTNINQTASVINAVENITVVASKNG